MLISSQNKALDSPINLNHITIYKKDDLEWFSVVQVLSLDGGGIRGLVLIQILMEIEAALGKPIQECFDWIGGTSTGGILALALARGLY